VLYVVGSPDYTPDQQMFAAGYVGANDTHEPH
jgi:hypothetical protein